MQDIGCPSELPRASETDSTDALPPLIADACAHVHLYDQLRAAPHSLLHRSQLVGDVAELVRHRLNTPVLVVVAGSLDDARVFPLSRNVASSSCLAHRLGSRDAERWIALPSAPVPSCFGAAVVRNVDRPVASELLSVGGSRDYRTVCNVASSFALRSARWRVPRSGLTAPRACHGLFAVGSISLVICGVSEQFVMLDSCELLRSGGDDADADCSWAVEPLLRLPCARAMFANCTLGEHSNRAMINGGVQVTTGNRIRDSMKRMCWM